MKALFLALMLVFMGAGITLSVLMYFRMGPFQKGTTVKTYSKNYHAIVLKNGQVYFGKIQEEQNGFLTIEDVYYFKVLTVPVPQPTSKQKTKQSTASASFKKQYTILKLGSEFHGPTDELMLNKDQVKSIEELKNDSKIVQAIIKYQEEAKKR